MKTSVNLPEWKERSIWQKVFSIVFVVAAVVGAYTMYHTIFVDYSLWVLEEACVAVLLLSDALARWNCSTVMTRVEACLGVVVTVALLCGMWIG